MSTAPNLWAPAPPTLWADDEIPTRTRDDWRSLAVALHPNDDTDRARMVRTKARGGVWYCPSACITASRLECDCPCGGVCHGGICIGH
jgi:hypothetical protein